MSFENLFEFVNFDFVLEGLGTIFGFGLIWKLFFEHEINQLIELFIITIC